MKDKAYRPLVLLLLAALCTWAGFAAGPAVLQATMGWLAGELEEPEEAEPDDPTPYERIDGNHFTIVDDTGAVILETGHYVEMGDEYVNAQNRHFRVVSIEGDRAVAQLLGMFSLDIDDENWARDLMAAAATPGPWYLPVQAPQTAVIGVYHTHADESYVVGDGAASKRGGGVIDVGLELVDAAREQGLKVLHEAERHYPHDSGAYRRSRRTASGLLRQGAGTLLDVHRDAAPRAAYATEIDGEPASQVMMVVGRANPQMQTTLNFARSFKRTLDEQQPGLVKGIYFGRGSYNQDLTPRAVLLEIGSHQTPKEHALRTAGIVGSAMPDILGVAGTPAAGAEQASRSNLAWIVLVVLLGSAAYLVVASGGWEPALAKLKGFFRQEFASALAPRQRSRGPGRREPLGKGKDGQDAADQDGPPAKPGS